MGQGAENVRKLYLEGIAGGDARAAVTRYTGLRYTQHSTGVADGVEGFLAFFEPFLERNPVREIEIVCLYEDGPWVFCSAFQSLNNGEARWVTTDLFYTDPDGLVLEHWDTIAEFVENTRSGESMVGGQRMPDAAADSSASKNLVLEYVKQVLQERNFDRTANFVVEDLIQHGAEIDSGRSGLLNWLQADQSGSYDMLFQIIAEGDMVVTYGKRHALGKDIAVFDIYRVRDGLIVEHWSNAEHVAPRDQWNNSGKF
ncbi:MAG: nuclear transport factor 2 family protein [Pseudomonadota bacterium]